MAGLPVVDETHRPKPQLMATRSLDHVEHRWRKLRAQVLPGIHGLMDLWQGRGNHR
ncbi:MAG: hypothetical protein ACXVXF_10425 [Mycobacteriaceae bacterium]